MIKKKKCLQCSKVFEFDTMARFRRKYCKKCSEKRKKMWDEQWKVKFEDLNDE
jgi:Zn finger protein HypA/HybF involved in hydrogenase expression